MTRLPLRRPERVDLVLAVLLGVGAAADGGFGNVGGSVGAKVIAAVATTAPLAWRTVAPLAAVVLSTSGVVLAAALGFDTSDALVATLAPLLAVYSLAELADPRRLMAGAAFALVAYVLAGVPDASAMSAGAAGVVLAVGVGRAVRVLGFETDVLQTRTTQLERDRDEAARQAVAEERERIARELHDVIGHSIAVMGVQAGAVRRVLPPELERERDMLVAVELTGRDAVTEMRRLLGLLRSDGVVAAEALPTLERTTALVDEMRAAGLDVTLQVDGALDDLPPGRTLAGFRILQEALTNALKHAPGAHVAVHLRRTATAVAIHVVDDHRGPDAPTTSTGHGLVGMRERVALYGGTLDAGPQPGGGFGVRAVLPLQGADA